MKRLTASLLSCFLTATASASLVYESTIRLSAQGFGSAPRDLTIQETGLRDGTSSGCVGVGPGGTFVGGPTAPRCGVDAFFAGNGVVSVGGDEATVLADNAKFGIPTLGSLGITNASQIGILFNATEPGGNSANVTDLTLNFFDTAGTFLTSIDGGFNFVSSNPGNGVAGFAFVVDAAQQTYLNGLIFNQAGFGGFILSLNATVADVQGGPESFMIFNRGTAEQCVPTPTVSCTPQEIPEPGTMALLGAALFGLITSARKKRNAAGTTRR